MRGILRYAAYGALAVGGAALCYYGYRRYYCGTQDSKSDEISDTTKTLSGSTKDADVIKSSVASKAAEEPPKDVQNEEDGDLEGLSEDQAYQEYMDALSFGMKLEALACFLFYQGRSDEELKEWEARLGPAWPMVLAYRDRVPQDSPMIDSLQE